MFRHVRVVQQKPNPFQPGSTCDPPAPTSLPSILRRITKLFSALVEFLYSSHVIEHNKGGARGMQLRSDNSSRNETRHQTRIILLITALVILGMRYESEPRTADDSVPAVTLRCEIVTSRHHPLFEKQESYGHPRGTFHTCLNEYQLFLVCSDRVSRRPNQRVDRSRDGRVETRTQARE